MIRRALGNAHDALVDLRALVFGNDDARCADALRHAEDTAEIVHVLNAVADDNQPRRIRGGEKFVKVRIDEIGG